MQERKRWCLAPCNETQVLLAHGVREWRRCAVVCDGESSPKPCWCRNLSEPAKWTKGQTLGIAEVGSIPLHLACWPSSSWRKCCKCCLFVDATVRYCCCARTECWCGGHLTGSADVRAATFREGGCGIRDADSQHPLSRQYGKGDLRGTAAKVMVGVLQASPRNGWLSAASFIHGLFPQHASCGISEAQCFSTASALGADSRRTQRHCPQELLLLMVKPFGPVTARTSLQPVVFGCCLRCCILKRCCFGAPRAFLLLFRCSSRRTTCWMGRSRCWRCTRSAAGLWGISASKPSCPVSFFSSVVVSLSYMSTVTVSRRERFLRGVRVVKAYSPPPYGWRAWVCCCETLEDHSQACIFCSCRAERAGRGKGSKGERDVWKEDGSLCTDDMFSNASTKRNTSSTAVRTQCRSLGLCFRFAWLQRWASKICVGPATAVRSL